MKDRIEYDMINGTKRIIPLRHKFGCPLNSMSAASNYENYEPDAISLRPIEHYSKANAEILKSHNHQKGRCTCFNADQNLQTHARFQIDYDDVNSQLELPVITKVYDFNPDDPSAENCLIDIQTYKRIIGLIEKQKPNNETSENFNNYDSDYGIFKNNTRTINGFYKSNGFNQVRKSERVPLFTDSFSFDRNLYVVAENPSPKKEHQMQGEINEDEVNEKSTVLLIKASEYVCKDNKLITDAFYPKKILKAIKKEKISAKDAKQKSPRKDKSSEPPDTELKIRRMRIYDDAIAMLQSIKAIPVSNNIRLRVASKESPKRSEKQKVENKPERTSPSKSPTKENRDIAEMLSPNNSEANDQQFLGKKYDVVIKTAVEG